MERSFTFTDPDQICSVFSVLYGRKVWLQQLCGLPCGLGGIEAGPVGTRGMCVLHTPGKRWEADDFELVETQFTDNSIRLVWSVVNLSLLWESHWNFSSQTGVWSRKDCLHNVGNQPVVITRCLARFGFAPGKYNIYTQRSNWSYENQLNRCEAHHGSLVVRSQGGRTTQGGTPYLCLTDEENHRGVSFHILPVGNWVIYIDQSYTLFGHSQPYIVIELGLSDETLYKLLNPGDVVQLPEILIQPIPQGQPEYGASNLHRYLIENKFQSNRQFPPLVYNTWFDAFEYLEVERLRSQLRAAKELGCEVFTIDAGWYGDGEGAWDRQVGDWREKTTAAFYGKMADFTEEVRTTGLGFGLWIEPERNHAVAPSVKAHPEWFLPGANGFFYPNLALDGAYRYVLGELSRLIETYQLAWMKVDFNFELGRDEHELSIYYARWYSLLNELCQRYPKVYLEGCASGGMRSDIHTLTYFEGHFLSDTVNPFDVLRISQGALLRLPPGKLIRWAVLRSIAKPAIKENIPLEQTLDTIVTPGRDSWDNAFVINLDFIVRVALPGIFGLSGDITGLSENVKQRLRHHIAFYKQWRAFFKNSVVHLLTPVRPKEDRQGWVAFQYQQSGQKVPSLLFVYRLNDGAWRRSFCLRNLDRSGEYLVRSDDESEVRQRYTGGELMDLGLSVELPLPNCSAVFVIDHA